MKKILDTLKLYYGNIYEPTLTSSLYQDPCFLRNPSFYNKEYGLIYESKALKYKYSASKHKSLCLVYKDIFNDECYAPNVRKYIENNLNVKNRHYYSKGLYKKYVNKLELTPFTHIFSEIQFPYYLSREKAIDINDLYMDMLQMQSKEKDEDTKDEIYRYYSNIIKTKVL